MWLLSYECYRPEDTHAGSQRLKALYLHSVWIFQQTAGRPQKAHFEALNLQRHKLPHSDKKPYSCDQCNISFRLKSHMRIHSEEKPYACEQCDYKCKRSENLKKTQDKEACYKNIEVKVLWAEGLCTVLNIWQHLKILDISMISITSILVGYFLAAGLVLAQINAISNNKM